MLARAAVVLAVAIPLVWFFGRAICTDEMFGYRDAAHYYYPYYWYVHEHWAHGIVPLWNPLENLGQPLAADPTAAAFYPAKLIFFLPLPYDWLYKVYIVGHVALCAAATYWLARQWQASRPAAVLAAIAYTFGGSVVMQYANVVYLVGAAWLPVALWGAHRIIVKRDWRGVLGFAFSTAMMILGGDPEAAYLAALAMFLLAFLEWRRQATEEGARVDSVRAKDPSYVALIGAALALAFGLSAIQLIPSIVWGQKSERALFDSPRSVYEIPFYLARSVKPEDPVIPTDPEPRTSWYKDLVGPPEPYTHHADVERFSVGPWRCVELLWPNFYGREFPANHRWGRILPQDESPWTPSLYFGLIPLLLAFTQLCFWSGPLRSRWLTWTLLILTLGSLGGYGIVWAIREAIYVCSGTIVEPPLGEGVGGVYWFFTVFLPGFVQFRYPAKLLVLATLCAALLAARGWDSVVAGRGGRLVASLAIVIALASAHLLVSLFLLPEAFRQLQFPPEPTLFGPLDIPGAETDLKWTLGQTAVVGLLAAAVLWLVRLGGASPRDGESLWPQWCGWLLVGIVACDLSLAHAWSVVLVPSSVWSVAQAARTNPQASYIYPQLQMRPLNRRRDFPEDASSLPWQVNATPDRMQEVVIADMTKCRPKYNLLIGLRVYPSLGSARAADVVDSWFEWSTTRVDWPQGHNAGDALTLGWGQGSARSCVGVAAEPIVMPVLHEFSRAALARRHRRVMRAASDHPRAAFCVLDRIVIESDDLPSGGGTSHANPVPSRAVEPLAGPLDRRTGYFVHSPGKQWFVFPEQYDSDFACEVTDLATGQKSETSIYRAQRILRAIQLPAGSFEVRFLYRPWAFYLGAALALVAWPIALCWLAWKGRASVSPSEPPE